MWFWIVVAVIVLLAYLTVFESPLWKHYDSDPKANDPQPMEIP